MLSAARMMERERHSQHFGVSFTQMETLANGRYLGGCSHSGERGRQWESDNDEDHTGQISEFWIFYKIDDSKNCCVTFL